MVHRVLVVVARCPHSAADHCAGFQVRERLLTLRPAGSARLAGPFAPLADAGLFHSAFAHMMRLTNPCLVEGGHGVATRFDNGRAQHSILHHLEQTDGLHVARPMKPAARILSTCPGYSLVNSSRAHLVWLPGRTSRIRQLRGWSDCGLRP